MERGFGRRMRKEEAEGSFGICGSVIILTVMTLSQIHERSSGSCTSKSCWKTQIKNKFIFGATDFRIFTYIIGNTCYEIICAWISRN